jgi:aspartate/methionine/tyrosine aminotransferase
MCAYPQRGISLGGLSKAFGLQGLRAGWLVCRDTALLQQVNKSMHCHVLALEVQLEVDL